MCYERLKNIAITRLMPVFKYVKGQDIPKDSKLHAYIEAHNSFNKIVSKNVAKTLKNVPEYMSFDELYDYMKTAPNCRRAAMAVLKNINMLSVNDLRRACKHLFEKYPDEFLHETNAERCVLCLDLKENYL